MPLERRISETFREFIASGKVGGIVLILCTLTSLVIANSPMGAAYLKVWHFPLAGLSIEHWINDALMAVFFLLIGLELERELYNGELSDFKNALLPMLAAIGGIAVPALIHLGFNSGTPMQAGAGIPMATDIAFALGVLALLGNKVPASLKIFLTALAVIDDLCAIVVIGVFYTADLSLPYLLGALAVFACLLAMNRVMRVMALLPYLVGGALMWFLMLKSGVHATIASARARLAQAGHLSDPADLRTGEHGYRDRRRLGVRAAESEQPGDHTGARRRQARRHLSIQLRGSGFRPVPPAARYGVASCRGRRGTRRHRVHDVHLHRQSRIPRKSRRRQRIQDGDSAGFAACRGAGICLLEDAGQ
jgi:hypothetical protein